jgi:minimal CRISPR polymerase domain
VPYYVGIDGDNVGSVLERLLILEQIAELHAFSGHMTELVSKLANAFSAAGGQIIFQGGDGLFAVFDSEVSRPPIEELVIAQKLITFSVGSGTTVREAYLALKIAKAQGKARWVDYREIQPQALSTEEKSRDG